LRLTHRSTKFDVAIRKMSSFRKDTTIVQQSLLNTVDDFFSNLCTNVSSPLTNVLFCSQGNDKGKDGDVHSW
jgi:hypothetical protein